MGKRYRSINVKRNVGSTVKLSDGIVPHSIGDGPGFCQETRYNWHKRRARRTNESCSNPPALEREEAVIDKGNGVIWLSRIDPCKNFAALCLLCGIIVAPEKGKEAKVDDICIPPMAMVFPLVCNPVLYLTVAVFTGGDNAPHTVPVEREP